MKKGGRRIRAENVATEAEVRQREIKKQRHDTALLLTLEVEDGAISQGIQMTSSNWKRQGKEILF